MGAPSHKEWKGPVKPNKDDIKAIQALYGAPGEERPEKGSRYWRYSPDNFGKLDRGFPKDISKGFEGIPNNIDAAFVWAKNDKIYFFKGSNYWKFDPRKDPPVAETYPRPLSNWEGVPDSIDAALRYSNDNTYFFKDGEYYRFNEDTFTVDTDGPAYPRPSTTWWFGCQTTSQKQ